MEKYTKSQLDRASFKILNEQTAPSINAAQYRQAMNTKPEMRSKQQQAILKGGMHAEWWNTYKHDVMMAAEIGALFIPVAGPAISMGVAALDAKMYWDEGDKYTGGFVAAMTAIPLIGSLAIKIPGVKQLGAKGISALAKKMKLIKAGKKPALTATEKTVIQQLGKNQKLVASETSKYYAKKIAAKKAGKKVATTAAKATGNYVAARNVWDWVYKNAGVQQAEIAALIDPSLKRLSATRKLKTAESKFSIKTIIREELRMLREQPVAAQDTTDTGQYTSDDAFKRLVNNTSDTGKVTVAILAVLGGLAVYKGYRFAKFKINLVRNALNTFNKNPAGFIKSWQAGKLEQELLNSKMFKRLPKAEQDRLLFLLRNPKAMTQTVALSVDDMITQYANGTISAAELKSVLPAESLAKYQSIIDSIEASRGTTYANPNKPITPKTNSTSPYGVKWHNPEDLNNI